MRRIIERLALINMLLAALLAGVGCDDDDGTAVEIHDPGEFDSGVTQPDASPVEGLDPTEVEQFCNQLAIYSETFVTQNVAGMCHYTGVLSGQFIALLAAQSGQELDTRKACEDVVRECTDNPELIGIQAPGADACPFLSDNVRTDCTATVAEVEACFNAVQDILLDTLESAARVECSEVSANTSLAPASETPASCTVVEQKCPGLLEEFGGM